MFGSHSISHFRYFGRAIYDMSNSKLGEFISRLLYMPDKWYVSAEFEYLEPIVSQTTLFSLIGYSSYRQSRFEVRRVVWRTVAVVGQVEHTVYTGDRSWRTCLSVTSGNSSIGWQHITGYAGDNDAFLGVINFEVMPKLEAYVVANAFRYRIDPEQVDLIHAYTATAGVRWRWTRGAEVGIEIQHLNNPARKNDNRLFLRVSKSFATRTATIGDRP